MEAEMLRVLLEIRGELGELKAEVKNLVALDVRVQALEERKNFALGWVSAVGAIVSAVVAFVVSNWGASDPIR
jgi:hypothetical protein